MKFRKIIQDNFVWEGGFYIGIICLIGAIILPLMVIAYAEEWKVMENIDGDWVEIKDAKITTDYVVYLGDKPYMKFTKTFINENAIGEFAFQETIEIDSTFEYETDETEQEFGTISAIILAIAIISIIAISAKSRLSVIPRY